MSNMFSSLELASSSSKRSKLWPFSGVGKLQKRRLVSHLMCRLPLLTLWTLVVIYILYKSLSDKDLINLQDVNEFQVTISSKSSHESQGRLYHGSDQNQLFIRQSSPEENNKDNHLHRNVDTDAISKIIDPKTSNVITKFPNKAAIISTTKKSTNNYARQSKVFILIVQNEDLRLSNPNKFHRRSSYHTDSISSSSSIKVGNTNHRIIVPTHIRLLIGILESHRIEYTIDTTRTGLPTTLLTDQDNISENKQYSVIIIDDFVKYTKLNRWIRDQLDRHCRTNKIGVITYLTADELDHQKSDIFHQPSKNGNHIQLPRGNNGGGASTTEESIANQFPLTYKLINQGSCRNSSSTCLVNYQLNERSPILRILKRKPNFILNGPLTRNLNQSPWISMSSIHITYEPLTWAKLRQSNSSYPPEILNSHRVPSTSTDTRQKNQNWPGAGLLGQNTSQQKSRPRDVYTDELQDQLGEYNAPQEYDENQLKIAPSQPLPLVNNKSDDSSIHETSSSADNYLSNEEDIEARQVLSMFDRGLYDGIKRVIFGGANHHWLNRILLIDAIEHLSSGRIIDPLERYIQIDIDDMFVGERGKRMNRSDVDFLVETQRGFAKRIDGGFKFNLGFSGKYYKHGNENENIGDEQLVSRAQEFTWFCHTWSHSKAHLFNKTHSIASELRKNLKFAQEHGLPIIGHDGTIVDIEVAVKKCPTYAIAPHHSGVYPIHEQLYEAWRDVLNVQVTSTEEYPRLRPANGRRAFVHKTINVLPRQTCGLYTHTIYRNKYPGGIGKLETSIRGGELFETILHNPVNIYMTHMSNYANDRLGPYAFSALFDFVQTNTNLQLKYAPSSKNQLGPSSLADYYFNLYPAEKQPLWTNPCNDERHLAIWAPEKHYNYCSIVPKLLIVGPQKTGTTALYSYLKINPLFKSSKMSSIDFEEVQFFNDKHYFEGVDWYFSRFFSSEDGDKLNSTNNYNQQKEENSFYFDKSATYFDDPKVPIRTSFLLPEARIVIMLVNPADRAYSWYQHMKAHGDPIANLMSFEQIIMSKDDELVVSPAVRSLRNRCLHPGYYSQHLSKWLEHYPSRKIIIIDGQWFRHNPASVMNRLQLLLRIDQPIDYIKLLVYDDKKGFYCQRDANSSTGVKCLGKSKGRKYPSMSQDARLFLNRHYWPHNRQLARILSDIGQPFPTWLDETMSAGHVSSVIF